MQVDHTGSIAPAVAVDVPRRSPAMRVSTIRVVLRGFRL
jgi:hypothetical protein